MLFSSRFQLSPGLQLAAQKAVLGGQALDPGLLGFEQAQELERVKRWARYLRCRQGKCLSVDADFPAAAVRADLLAGPHIAPLDPPTDRIDRAAGLPGGFGHGQPFTLHSSTHPCRHCCKPCCRWYAAVMPGRKPAIHNETVSLRVPTMGNNRKADQYGRATAHGEQS